MRNKSGIVVLAFVALFWNGIVGVFHVVIAHQWIDQRDAQERFVPVEAKVLESHVERVSSSDGGTYKPHVRFSYEFEGRDFSSDRVSFISFSTSDKSYAKKIVGEYPVGRTADAFVDPDNPSSAALDVSGDGFPAFVLVLLAPFQFIGLFLLAQVVKAIRAPKEEDELRAKYVRVDTPEHLVIGRPRMSFLGVFTLSMTLLCFLSLLPIMGFFGMFASITVVAVTFGTCVAMATGFAMWRRSVGKRPENFVHINRRIRTFAFPADAPGEPIDSIRSILVDPRPISLTVNGVRQVDHHFEVETDRGTARLFEMRGGPEEGDGVLDILRSELM